MKITKSKSKINPFGGINFCIDLLSKEGIPSLIDQHLGKRVLHTGFDYSSILMNQLAIFFTGGDCAEDINEHLRPHLKHVKELSVCSADTILRGIKELATPVETLVNSTGVVHQFNINRNLNELLVKVLKHTNQLKSESKQEYTLDYDNQIIATEKHDAKRTYKKSHGYQPGVACIGDNIVYIEGRNGNSQAKFQQSETLRRAFDLLFDAQIPIKRFRADGASYQQKVVDLVRERSEKFYIRARMTSQMEQRLSSNEEQNWKKARLGVQEMETTQIADYLPFDGKTPYRLVVSRIKRKDKQTNMFSGSYTYRAILTNDLDWNEQEVISFYNQRGKAEKVFDFMGNDFGWTKLPCSFLGENTSFMLLTALYANLYRFILSRFSEKLDWLKPNFRIKKFIFRFITVAAKWIKSGRQNILKLYTYKDYSPLIV